MSGYRRAALALHALASADRRWLLSRLADAQRERLRPLLGELKTLGARFDSADIEAIAAEGDDESPMRPTPPEAPAQRLAETAVNALGDLEAGMLARSLGAEPDWIVTMLWQAAGTAGRERLREALGAARAAVLVDRPAGRGDSDRTSTRLSGLGPNVQRALFAALRQRAVGGGGGGATVGGTSAAATVPGTGRPVTAVGASGPVTVSSHGTQGAFRAAGPELPP